MNFPWKRILKIYLRADNGREICIDGTTKEALNIEVRCHKYLSVLQDAAEIRVSNLSYNEMIKIISGQFYHVEIVCGYENRGTFTIFKGGVLYISDSVDDVMTNTVIILCTSELLARYGQIKMNLTLNSSINIYSAIKFIARQAGIDSNKIHCTKDDLAFKDLASLNGMTIQSFIDNLCSKNLIEATTDYSSNAIVSIASTDYSKGRRVRLENDMYDLSGGYPRLTNSGLTFTVLPVFNFMPGDVLQIDNSILDISANSLSEAEQSYANYLNTQGLYKLRQIDYRLTNRSNAFSATITCFSKLDADGIYNQNLTRDATQEGMFSPIFGGIAAIKNIPRSVTTVIDKTIIE